MVCAFDHRYVKRAIWRIRICTVTELEGLGATYAVHLRLIGKLVGDFLSVIIELFSLGAFVLSQGTRLTDRQTLIARCDLTKLDAHNNASCMMSLHHCNGQEGRDMNERRGAHDSLKRRVSLSIILLVRLSQKSYTHTVQWSH